MSAQTRLAYLKSLLKAREGKAEYRDNVKAIRAEIATIEQELPRDGG